jgi:uncharacterized alpha/beta hydrolase family protein
MKAKEISLKETKDTKHTKIHSNEKVDNRILWLNILGLLSEAL